MIRYALPLAALLVAGCSAGNEMIVINDNGGWCWFQDERALVVDDQLIVASVANRAGARGDERWGDVQISAYDLAGRKILGHAILHKHLEDDDYAQPALLLRDDGRFLAVYATHGTDHMMRWRISKSPANALEWMPEQQMDRGVGVTYSNLYRLSEENGRIYNFYRGEHWNPNVVVSDDGGETWAYGGHVIEFAGRPYARYASNGRDTIHFITTEHHPRNYNNSIYHGFIRGGKIHQSDGAVIRALAQGPISPAEATRVFAGDVDNVGWTVDIQLDPRGNPVVVYSVQRNQDTQDLRYGYARWDGSQWHSFPMAHAGTALYEGEGDYTGLAALAPHDLSTVYISTNADPVTGAPLVSNADGRRHYEIFRGRTGDGGKTWTWKAITSNSTVDNLRPIIPRDPKGRTILLWLRGTYTTYKNYDLQVVALVNP